MSEPRIHHMTFPPARWPVMVCGPTDSGRTWFFVIDSMEHFKTVAMRGGIAWTDMQELCGGRSLAEIFKEPIETDRRGGLL